MWIFDYGFISVGLDRKLIKIWKDIQFVLNTCQWKISNNIEVGDLGWFFTLRKLSGYTVHWLEYWQRWNYEWNNK